MRVNEIFYSLQGEGGLAGVPSVFIRLAGCPLRCRWCDTAYAWDFAAGTEQTPEALLSQFAEYPTRHLVLTGGEPLVQDNVAEFVRVFADAGCHITVETAGIRFLPELQIHLASISPKLSNSITASSPARPEGERLNIVAIRQLIEAYPYQLKFVVETPYDLNEIAACIEQIGTVDPERVYLMPQASRREDYIEKSKWLADYCLQSGFLFSPRLHVMLYDGQKGK
jgi:7-carboxy-7-deazaguanine synthase